MNLVVETKGKDEVNLGVEEEKKIKSAEMFFEMLNKNSNTKVNIEFKRQLKNERIAQIIQDIVGE